MHRLEAPNGYPLRRWVALVLVAIAVVLTLPHYFAGTWFCTISAPSLAPLIALRQTGLDLPGWQTQRQQLVNIGGHQWSLQAIAPLPTGLEANPVEAAPYLLLIRPQTSQSDQPQVEWMDINGVQSFTTDQRQQIRFVVKPSGLGLASSEHSFKSTARFFRGRNSDQTYAVLQWYAWADGGSPISADWFVADQVAQWRDRHTLPWVAVCVLIPINPLADGLSVQPVAIQLGQAIHASLVSVFARVDELSLTPHF